MKIVLLRHGKPDIPEKGKVSASEFADCVETYNNAGIKQDFPLPNEVASLIGDCNMVVCSHLKRSVDSANFLGFEAIDVIDPLYREMEIPAANWHSIKLSPLIWVLLFRLLWLMGYSPKVESYSSAKSRAYAATEKLVEMAKKENAILLVGHGLLNRFIAKYLRSCGWRNTTTHGGSFWKCSVYEMDK